MNDVVSSCADLLSVSSSASVRWAIRFERVFVGELQKNELFVCLFVCLFVERPIATLICP
jgi:hypothetical protein